MHPTSRKQTLIYIINIWGRKNSKFYNYFLIKTEISRNQHRQTNWYRHTRKTQSTKITGEQSARAGSKGREGWEQGTRGLGARDARAGSKGREGWGQDSPASVATNAAKANETNGRPMALQRSADSHYHHNLHSRISPTTSTDGSDQTEKLLL